jgi:hypothetical protein
MFRFTFCQKFLLVVLALRQTDAVSPQCSELKSEIDRVKELNHRNELLARQCYVSRYYTVHVSSMLCSPVLCEWLLCRACVVSVIQLYVAQCYVSCYYTVHVSSVSYSYM